MTYAKTVKTRFVLLCVVAVCSGCGQSASRQLDPDVAGFFAGSDTLLGDLNSTIDKCMKIKGFDYVAPPVFKRSVTTSRPLDLTLITDSDTAKHFGYGIVNTIKSSYESDAFLESKLGDLYRTAPERESYQKALYDGSGACALAAQQEISEKNPAFGQRSEEKVDHLFDDFFKRALENKVIVAANARWAACMAESGFPKVSTPWKFREELADVLWQESGKIKQPLDYDPNKSADYGALYEREIAAASKDSLCQEKTLTAAKSEYVAIEREVFGRF